MFFEWNNISLKFGQVSFLLNVKLPKKVTKSKKENRSILKNIYLVSPKNKIPTIKIYICTIENNQ